MEDCEEWVACYSSINPSQSTYAVQSAYSLLTSLEYSMDGIFGIEVEQ